MFNGSCFFGDLSQVFLNRILAPTVCAKDGTLTLRVVTGAFQKILWEQVVTCSGHSKAVSYTHLTLPTRRTV